MLFGEEYFGGKKCYYGIKEKDIKYKVAKKVKEELEQYPNVTVVLTREKEETVSLYERANRARGADADILISLHFNASNSHESEGASAYVTTGAQYCESMQKLADNLLGEFEALGLEGFIQSDEAVGTDKIPKFNL